MMLAVFGEEAQRAMKISGCRSGRATDGPYLVFVGTSLWSVIGALIHHNAYSFTLIKDYCDTGTSAVYGNPFQNLRCL
jgi:hypothetical protein